MKRILAFLAAALALAALPATARTYHRFTATIRYGGAAQANVPTPLRLSPALVPGFDYDDTDGTDFEITDESGALLPYEIDAWNPTGESFLWVKVPAFETNKVLTVVYGRTNENLSARATEVWSAYAGVWHMNEADAVDSTANHFDGTASGAVSAAASGRLGAAVSIDGETAWSGISCGPVLPNPELLTNGCTVSAWVNPSAYNPTNHVKYQDGFAIFGKTGCLSVRFASETQFVVTTPSGADHKISNLTLPATGTWFHVATTLITNTTAGCKLFLNGSLAGSKKGENKAPINATETTAMFLGRNQWELQGWRGDLDEIRLMTHVAPPGYLAAEYAAMAQPDLLEYGPLETLTERTGIDLRAIKPDGFSRGVVITVHGYGANQPPLTNFPVLVRLSAGKPSGFAYSDCLLGDGEDLCFRGEDGTPLAHEVDTWEPAGESFVWVSVPRLTNGTEFAMFYRASRSAVDALPDAGNVWPDYTGVWHLGEPGSGANRQISDSTTNGLHGLSAAKNARVANGAIGGAQAITDEGNQKTASQIAVPLGGANSPERAVVDALAPTFTVSLWYRLPTSSTGDIKWEYLIGRRPIDKAADGGWALQMDDDSGTYAKGLRIYSCETTAGTDASTARPRITDFYDLANTWIKLDAVYYEAGGGAKWILYHDGAEHARGDFPGAVLNGTGDLGLGGGAATKDGDIRPLYGDLDEVRLRRGAASAAWVAADYATQHSPSSFLRSDPVESLGESTAPVAVFSVPDTGAAFVQFAGTVTAVGAGASSCAVRCKVWPAGTAEPDAWTTNATGLAAGGSFTNFVVGLTPLTLYSWKLQAANDLGAGSDVATNSFTTSGVGDAGAGGSAVRILDEFVHTFTVSERGQTSYSFVPPTGVTSVEALVVAGGGAGGCYGGGGGGGGGLVHLDALAVVPGETLTVEVGKGGAASASVAVRGGNGGDSAILRGSAELVRAIGGGAGGNSAAGLEAGAAGGSGGGGATKDGAGGAAADGQGHAGAKGAHDYDSNDSDHGGGGGGAGAAGGEPTFGGTKTCTAGGGGAGRYFPISGDSVCYGGGGGGGGGQSFINSTYGQPGGGGDGGGGRGGQYAGTDDSAVARSGADGLGGGGGGGSMHEAEGTTFYRGGDGGSGVVLLRYGAGGSGAGVAAPTVSFTGLSYDDASGRATASFRVGWAGEGRDDADVLAIWGYAEDSLRQTNAVAAAAIGRGSETFELPRMSRTVYIRLVATNDLGHAGASPEIRSLELFNPDAPVATIRAMDVGCTNATFAVDVTDLGGASTNAAAELQLCPDKFFDEGNYSTIPFDGSLAATGSLSIAVFGLATNETVWARAVVTNSLAQDFTTAPVAVTTVAPGAPVPAGAVASIGFTTLGVDARIDAWGAGSYAATMFVEASTDPDFGTIAARSEPRSVAATNVYERFGLTGLQGGGTEYYLRVGATNEWGIGAYAEIPSAVTRATPVAVSGIAYSTEVVDGTNTLSVLFGVTAVFDGVRSTATLYYGPSATSSPRVSQKAISGPGTLRWDGLAAADKPMYAIVVVSAYAGGGMRTERWSVRILPGSRTYRIADFAEFQSHASSENALLVKPGDAVVLPEAIGRESYRVLNGRFATLAGTTLIALEPGICGVEFIRDGDVLSTLALLVLPERIRDGGVWIFDERSITDQEHPWPRWDDAASWRAIVASTNDWPRAPDDIAIIPFYRQESATLILHDNVPVGSPLSVGAIYAGGYRDAPASIRVNGPNAYEWKTLAFDRTDGRPALLQLCGNTTGVGTNWEKKAYFGFGDRLAEVRWNVDTRIDAGWPGGDSRASQGRLGFDSRTNTVAAGATLSLHEFDPMGQRGSSTVALRRLAGSGTIWNRSPAMVRIYEDASLFSGLLRDSGGHGTEDDTCTGPIFVQTDTTTNCTGETVGWVGRKGEDPSPDFARGVGCFQTGWPDVTRPPKAHGPWFPKKGFSMHGGLLRLQGEWNESWNGTDPRGSVRDPDYLEIDGGFDYLYGADTLRSYPTVWFEAGGLRHPGTASLLIRDESVMGTGFATNQVTILHGVSDFAIGPAGDPATSWFYPIVPWIAQLVTDSYIYIGFGAFDANDRLVRTPFFYEASKDDHRDERIDLADWPDGANACCRFGSLALAADKTLNSLYLQNDWSSDSRKLLGAGRTLTIASGGLILGESKYTDGVTRIGAEDGGATNGTLRLGDENRPAYVWAHGAEKFSTDRTKREGPCQIWADVVAPGGLVACYTGALLLGGCQTNIEKEIVVNAGTLVLGTTNTACRLRPDLPVRIHANAKLAVPNADSLAGTILRMDGAAGWFGTIEIEAGVEATCKKLYRRDYPEKPEWESLPRGVYTGDEATAVELGCFYEPGLFSGAGTLSVYRDDIIMPTIMILR